MNLATLIYWDVTGFKTVVSVYIYMCMYIMCVFLNPYHYVVLDNLYPNEVWFSLLHFFFWFVVIAV